MILLLAGIAPVAAGAQALRSDRVCHAGASGNESWAAVDARPDRWRCNDSDWSLSADAVLIRFELGPEKTRAMPRSLVTHTGNFDRVEIGLIDGSGKARWASYRPDEVHHLSAGPYIVLPLAHVTAETRTVAVRMVRPWSKTLVSEMRLDPAPEGTGWPLPRIIAMAAICGMLVVPLLINTAFYSVLPERYVIWHLVMVASMLVQAAFATGFVHLFLETGAGWEWQASNLAFATMSGAALLFAATFIEDRALSPRLRRLALRLGPVMWGIGVVCSVPLEVLRPLSSPVMHVSIGGVIVVLALMLRDAKRRGSKSVRLQILAWAPIMLLGTWRILSYLVPALHPTELIELYHLALALEVLVTAFGIVNRFLEVRQQRDVATARALELEGVADRDPLTGLRNRRTIEKRFDRLFATGFRTMAVIDLDHFKAVNDTFGHAMGDVVLRAAAGALPDDRDTRAIRMGGEEFLLLLRGADAAMRAERCRRAISTRIAAEVPGLDRMVTASMGLVEHDQRGLLQIDFTALYARCDQLLYEAKRLGRNRMMKEKVTGFAATGRAVA